MNNILKRGLLKVGVASLVMFFAIASVEAQTCTNQMKADLNNAAKQVKAVIEVSEERGSGILGEDPETGIIYGEHRITYTFKITIYNITDNIYVRMQNGLTGESREFFQESAVDGVHVYTTTEVDNIITYTFSVLANVEGCPLETLKTFTLIKPKHNILASYDFCFENEEVPYCHKFITKEIDIELRDMSTAIDEYKRVQADGDKEDNGNRTIWGWLGDNYIYIIAGIIILGGIAVGTVYYVRKRRVI